MPPLQGLRPDTSRRGKGNGLAPNNENLSAAASTPSTSVLAASGSHQGSSSMSQNIASDLSGGRQNQDEQRRISGSVQSSNERTVPEAIYIPSNRIARRHPFYLPLLRSSVLNDYDSATVSERPLHLPLPANNCVSANIALPPNWNENMENVAKSLNPYKLFPVDSRTQEFRSLTKLVSPLTVCYIDRIVNPTVWTRFDNARKRMLKAKCSDPMVLKELGFNDEEIARKQQSMNFLRHNALDAAPFDDNFALLFHCTRDPANIEMILRDGFDERLSRGGVLGKGIYFADRAIKSILYDRNGSGVVFICAVLLGDCFTYKDFPSRDVADSVKGPQKLPAEQRFIDDYNFDSVMGQFRFNEYAVYNRYQCYPLYKVTYSRIQSRFDVCLSERATPPPFGWLGKNEFYRLADNSTWTLHAKTVFDEMKGLQAPTLIDRATAPTQQKFDEKLGRTSDYPCHSKVNLETVNGHGVHIGSTTDAHFQRNSGVVKKLQKRTAAANRSSFMDSPFDENILKKPQMALPTTESQKKQMPSLDTITELCWICCNSYSKMPNNLNMLPQCEHKVCANCFKKTREKMAGVSDPLIKCPFCQFT